MEVVEDSNQSRTADLTNLDIKNSQNHGSSEIGTTKVMSEIASGQGDTDSEHVCKLHGQPPQLVHEKDVTVHPLMCMPTQSSSEDDDLEAYPIKKKRPLPPPRPPKPKLPAFDSAQEKSGSKSMISSVLFNQKARTQLFSSLKKGLQQYTASSQSIVAAGDESNGESNSKSEFGKGLRDRSLEPLSFVKKKSVEDSIKEEDTQIIRQRSSSENNIRGIHSKCLVDEKKDLASSESSPFIGLKRSPATTVVSLSTLLADRHETIEGVNPLHINKPVIEKPVAKEDLKVKTEKSDMTFARQINSVTKPTTFEDCQVKPLSLFSIYILAIPTFLFYILPLPFSLQVTVISFFMGAILATGALCLLVSPKKQITTFKPPYITKHVPYRIPKSVFNLHESYKGWMNEIDEYETETYHIAATTSVFVTLEGSTLRLQTPKRNITKRAVHGEKTIQPSNVVRSRVMSLQDARVYLIPHDLVKKRVWSKKYPICIEILEPKPDRPELCSEEKLNEEERICKEKIYLFGRTLPEKERWFYRFQRAITISQQADMKDKTSSTEKVSNTSYKSLEEMDEEFEIIDDQSNVPVDPVKLFQNYFVYMCRLLPDPDLYRESTQNTAGSLKPVLDFDQQMIQFSSLAHDDALTDVITTQPGSINKSISAGEPTLDVAWFNVVVGRVMFDFFRMQKWADLVAAKLQKKLEKIRLPYFMEGLKLTAIDLGKTVPLVHKISLPRMDAQGIWLDMDITYNGSVQMTLETKLVLTRLGKKEEKVPHLETRASAALNSDEEDSAESSDDDESLLTQALPTYVQHLVPKGSENSPAAKHKSISSSKKNNTGTPSQEKKWVRVMDSITKSKYFQKVTENSYVKKKLETVSNTPLILTAELNHCNGTLSINIPPPPSDRIWFGFKEPPEMSIKAKPKFGERAVTVTPITDWIEKKLGQEFNKIFVLPNMDDIPIPIMFNNMQKPS